MIIKYTPEVKAAYLAAQAASLAADVQSAAERQAASDAELAGE